MNTNQSQFIKEYLSSKASALKLGGRVFLFNPIRGEILMLTIEATLVDEYDENDTNDESIGVRETIMSRE